MSKKGVNCKICSLFFGKKAKKRRIRLRTLFMRMQKMFMNSIAFEQRYTTTVTTECYKYGCWCLFGKEFSSGDAGDGPCPFLDIHDDWTLGYESFSALHTTCNVTFYIYNG